MVMLVIVYHQYLSQVRIRSYPEREEDSEHTIYVPLQGEGGDILCKQK